MIRHVVVFTWSESADVLGQPPQRRHGARPGLDVGGMTAMTVAEDAGLTPGNAHAVLIADFPDADAYARYAQDPVHQAVIAEHIRPHLAARSAVQIEV